MLLCPESSSAAASTSFKMLCVSVTAAATCSKYALSCCTMPHPANDVHNSTTAKIKLTARFPFFIRVPLLLYRIILWFYYNEKVCRV